MLTRYHSNKLCESAITTPWFLTALREGLLSSHDETNTTGSLYGHTWPSHVCSTEVCYCHGYYSAHVATTWLVTLNSGPIFLCKLWLPNLNLELTLPSLLHPFTLSCRSFILTCIPPIASSLVLFALMCHLSILSPMIGSFLPTSLSLSPCPFSPLPSLHPHHN